MHPIRWIVATLAAGALVLAAGPALAAPGNAGKPKVVKVASNFYSPTKVTVRAGEKLRFKWTQGLELHDVNVQRGPQRFSSPLKSNGTWSTPRLKKGSYVLRCSLHEMSLKLTVRR